MSRTYISQVLLAGLGGFFGSSARFVISGWVNRLFPFAALPYGTFAVNVIGCFALGGLAGLAEFRQLLGSPSQRIFLMIGVLGGFTTFSTFAYETFELTQDKELARALANVAVQVIVGFGAAALGYIGARYV